MANRVDELARLAKQFEDSGEIVASEVGEEPQVQFEAVARRFFEAYEENDHTLSGFATTAEFDAEQARAEARIPEIARMLEDHVTGKEETINVDEEVTLAAG